MKPQSPIPLIRSERRDPCVLCEQTNYEILFRRDRDCRPLTTVICTHCGLVSHESIPNNHELAEYYSKEYRQEYHGEFHPSGRRVLREWKRGSELAARLSTHTLGCRKLFEIGAGIGCNVKQFELAGLDASGIEPGCGFQQYAKRHLKADISKKFFQDLRTGGQYDIVLMVHVLEHLNEPVQAFETIRKLLIPGGLAYIEVPNLEAPHSRPGRLFHFAHIYNFTGSTLAMLARKCGFRIKHAFSRSSDKNLMILLERTDHEMLTLDQSSYHCTRQAIDRYNNLTYHLRWKYIKERCRALYRQHSTRLATNYRLNHIIQRCQEPPQTVFHKVA
ncbi:MAG: class I SAM-dependent methyltransferase [Planctomycetota bacterium]|nr:class I SAM-dependent methyltransferase [Planctomycetota bacterium]